MDSRLERVEIIFACDLWVFEILWFFLVEFVFFLQQKFVTWFNILSLVRSLSNLAHSFNELYHSLNIHTYPTQSAIREYEAKISAQSLRHEELLLEMQSQRRGLNSPRGSWSRSDSLSVDLHSPGSGDTPGTCCFFLFFLNANILFIYYYYYLNNNYLFITIIYLYSVLYNINVAPATCLVRVFFSLIL